MKSFDSFNVPQGVGKYEEFFFYLQPWDLLQKITYDSCFGIQS